MSRRALIGPLCATGLLALAAVHAWVLPPTPRLATTAAWPTAENAAAVPLSDYLWVGTHVDDDLIAWAEGDTRLQPWLLADRRLEVALVEVTRHGVRVGGEEVLGLVDGLVPEDARKRALVSALYDTLIERVESTRALERASGADLLHGRVLVAADRDIPGHTLHHVLYTVRQAGLANFALVVDDGNAPALDRNRRVPRDARRSDILTGGPAGCGVATLPMEERVGQQVAHIDRMAGLGMPLVTLAWMETKPVRRGWPDHVPVPRSLAVDGTLSVLSVADPPLVQGADPPQGAACLPDGRIAEMTLHGQGLGWRPGNTFGRLVNGGVSRPSCCSAKPYGQMESESGVALTFGEPIVLGPIDHDDVGRTLRRNQNQLRYCYQREQSRGSELGTGKVTVKFTVRGDGGVSSATVMSSTLDSKAVDECAAGRFLRMTFPPVDGGGIAIIRVPVNFTGRP
ncbi:MAG: TonB family protein [Myxococcota bacterium]|jgi:TonB family protein